MIDASPLLNKRALLKLGYTPGLILSVLGQPDKKEHHRHGYKAWEEHLYTRDRVDEGMRDPRFLATQEKRKLRAEKLAKRQNEIPKRYTDWREALPEACHGLHSLNRYAKWRQCSPLHKHEIYRLKNEFVELLYRHSYCTGAWIHKQNVEAQRCRECSGDGELCDHCGGSGIWREARVFETWCFRFLVGEKVYTWHQLLDLVTFSPVASVPPQDWEGLAVKEKPISIPQNRFAAVKELISWTLAAARDEEAATPQTSSSPSLTSSADPLQDSIPF